MERVIIEGALETPDGAWRVEVVRRPGRGRWYRVVHDGTVVDWLTIDGVRSLLADADVELATLVEVSPR